MVDIVDIYSSDLQDVCIGKVVLTVSNDTDSSVGFIQVRGDSRDCDDTCTMI